MAKLEEEFTRKVALAEEFRRKLDYLGKRLDAVIRDLKVLAK